ncbi:MAG: hypothetical protein U0667_08085 [Chloroflexota bacterium]
MEAHHPSDTAALVPVEIRRHVVVSSSDARLEWARLATADAALREARRAAAEARAHQRSAVESLDQRGLLDRKEAARKEYRTALAAARGAEERRVAAATWLAAVDQLNRTTRVALGQVLLWKARLEALERQVTDAEWRAAAQRVRAESAEEATSEARRRVLDADRSADATNPGVRAVRVGRVDMPMLRGLLDGGDAIRDMARQLAGLTGGAASRWVLLLRTLGELIVASAIADDRLRFDRTNPLWAQMAPDLAREVMRWLRGLGFRYDPHDGWYGDRAPQPRDLAEALAFAGIEPVSLRPMPTAADLERLPESIGVAAVEYLAEHAPSLELDSIRRLAGIQAPALADVWDHWADVRALLAGEAGPASAD